MHSMLGLVFVTLTQIVFGAGILALVAHYGPIGAVVMTVAGIVAGYWIYVLARDDEKEENPQDSPG
jgi:glycopeptide antibiotics resistance protein